MTPDTDADEAHHIEISKRQRERLDRIKAECTNDYLPEPTDEQMVKSLMDTWDAVKDGYYSENEENPAGEETEDSRNTRIDDWVLAERFGERTGRTTNDNER